MLVSISDQPKAIQPLTYHIQVKVGITLRNVIDYVNTEWAGK